MLTPFLLSLALSAGQPGPGFLPWPADAGPDPSAPANLVLSPRAAEAAPASRAATLWLEVIEDDLPSFPIPVHPHRDAAAARPDADMPSFEIPVRRPAPETGSLR